MIRYKCLECPPDQKQQYDQDRKGAKIDQRDQKACADSAAKICFPVFFIDRWLKAGPFRIGFCRVNAFALSAKFPDPADTRKQDRLTLYFTHIGDGPPVIFKSILSHHLFK